MKHVFKTLEINLPKLEIGKPKKPCRYKVATCIIEKDSIVCVREISFMDDSEMTKAAKTRCEEHDSILVNIALECGLQVNGVIAPNMEYFGVILGDVTF